MEVQSFSSIFELFATFTLAYVLVDEFTPDPFVSVIADKILRMYDSVYKEFKDIRTNINAARNDLATLVQSKKDIEEIAKDDFEKLVRASEKLLESTEYRANQSLKEIVSEIKNRLHTKRFAYLNFFLLLFCLFMLFISGFYNNTLGKTPYEESRYIASLDLGLFLFLFGSITYLVTVWARDNRRKNGDTENIKKGYLTSLIVWFCLVALAVIEYFAGLFTEFFYNCYLRHDILVYICVFLPLSNFLVYMFKAYRRAKKDLPDLEHRAKQYFEDYKSEITKVNKFCAAYGFNKDDLLMV
ncbi:MAG: hypothetical protein SFU20_13290 [Chitinophagaceae bacterium]|nr:hypothetical protein [Chitinophagaceae bacterium]